MHEIDKHNCNDGRKNKMPSKNDDDADDFFFQMVDL